MLIYSVMPYSFVFPGEIPKRRVLKVKGGFVETDAKNKILRIISTDLKMYTANNPGDVADFT